MWDETLRIVFEYTKHSFGCIHSSVLAYNILQKSSQQILVIGSGDNNSKVENLRMLFFRALTLVVILSFHEKQWLW